jgi:hypothetical protein
MQTFSAQTRNRLFLIFVVLALAGVAVMSKLDGPLHTTAAPRGIISFELAWSHDNARAILDSWDATARLYAACLQGLDYLFLCLYSTALALGCFRASDIFRSRGWSIASIGVALAWLQWIAGFSDAIENVPLAVMILTGEVWGPLPQIATISATIKFVLVACGLLYTLVSLVGRGRKNTE